MGGSRGNVLILFVSFCLKKMMSVDSWEERAKLHRGAERQDLEGN